jgi:hypothetical protein
MFGDENSTMIFFLPLEGSVGSRRPRFVLKPKEGPFLRMEGMTMLSRGPGL